MLLKLNALTKEWNPLSEEDRKLYETCSLLYSSQESNDDMVHTVVPLKPSSAKDFHVFKDAYDVCLYKVFHRNKNMDWELSFSVLSDPDKSYLLDDEFSELTHLYCHSKDEYFEEWTFDMPDGKYKLEIWK